MPGKMVVIGAGATGLSAAYFAALAGFEVTCLEKERVGSESCSSMGWIKILRYAYDDSYYTALMRETEPYWRSLEAAYGHTLIRRCPSLNFGRHESAGIQSARQSLQTCDRPHLV